MIIVHVEGAGDVKVDADTWTNDGDGDLDLWKGKDNRVATFPQGRWHYVHAENAVAARRLPPIPGPPRPPLAPPGYEDI